MDGESKNATRERNKYTKKTKQCGSVSIFQSCSKQIQYLDNVSQTN